MACLVRFDRRPNHYYPGLSLLLERLMLWDVEPHKFPHPAWRGLGQTHSFVLVHRTVQRTVKHCPRKGSTSHSESLYITQLLRRRQGTRMVCILYLYLKRYFRYSCGTESFFSLFFFPPKP